MDRILFQLGPISIYTFGAGLAIATGLSFWLAIHESKRFKMDPDQMWTLVMLVLVAGVLGARLFFVLFYSPAFYWQHPLDIFKIYEGGLSIHGGILGGILAGWWYTTRHAISFWKAADILAPALILGQAVARLGCDVYGKVMAQAWPWGVHFQGQLVHPVQVYEIVLDLVLFIFLWGKRDRQSYPGQLFIYYLGGYAGIRLLLELFRDNPSLIGGFTPAHITSTMFIIAAIALNWRRARYAIPEQKERQPYTFWVSPIVWGGITGLAAVCIWIFYALNG